MTIEHDLHAVVRLKAASPKDNLPSGTVGTVVHVFSSPHRAYGVEFCDQNGRTIAQPTLNANEIESVAPRLAASA